MRSCFPALFALASLVVVTGCDRSGDTEPKTEAAAEPAPQAQAPKQAAKPKAEPASADTGTAAAPEPKQALRFDMTQDGEAQTAEKFETWMDEQGVRVAEGTEGEAAAGATEVGAEVKAKAEVDPHSGH
jgi:hypothetical protein